MPEEENPSKKKRPYKPPLIRTDKVFERRALACGKVPQARGRLGCVRNIKNS